MRPLKRAAGSGLHSFVFGSGALYIQSLERWKRGSSSDSKLSSHQAFPAQPKARPSPIPDASPTLTQPPSPATGTAPDSFAATGPPSAPASKKVNQTAAV